jgi:hypothetical protein
MPSQLRNLPHHERDGIGLLSRGPWWCFAPPAPTQQLPQRSFATGLAENLEGGCDAVVPFYHMIHAFSIPNAANSSAGFVKSELAGQASRL